MNPKKAPLLLAAALLVGLGFRAEAAGPYQFNPITPCRVIDTRTGLGGFHGLMPDGPPGVKLTVKGACGVPFSAAAVAVNVTAADATAAGSLTLYPGTGTPPGTSTISFPTQVNRATSTVIGLVGGTLSVHNAQTAGTVNLVMDVSGFFQ